MNKLLPLAAIAVGFFLLATENVQAQPRPTGYRQAWVRPVPQPLPVVRVTYAAPAYSTLPYYNWSAPAYPYPYAAPVYPYSSYYPNYYQSAYPSYYPSYNPYVNPYTYPGY